MRSKQSLHEVQAMPVRPIKPQHGAEKSFREIGDVLGISKSRANQCFDSGMEKLRKAGALGDLDILLDLAEELRRSRRRTGFWNAEMPTDEPVDEKKSKAATARTVAAKPSPRGGITDESTPGRQS